jgi:hypothetical protein
MPLKRSERYSIVHLCPSMKCLSLLLWLCLSLASAFPQTAVVTRNVYLRADPSTNHHAIKKLLPEATVDLLAPSETNGFYHVKAAGTAGWVWGRNVKIQAVPPPPSAHIGPPTLYPDKTLTPGLAATLSVSDLTKTYTVGCPSGKSTCTYSQAHRNVPLAEHTHVYDEYHVASSARNFQDGEVDHFYPLCAGGSNDITNLWYQPATNGWNGKNMGYHEKDKLEDLICKQIKAGTMDPTSHFNA